MAEALELLRFMALSAAVHADAVQCLVDDTRSVLSQMALDQERLDTLEGQLSTLLEEQRRLHAMRDVVSRSRSLRRGEDMLPKGGGGSNKRKCQAAASVVRSKSGSAEVPPRATTLSNIEDVLRFASSAVPEEDVPFSETGRHGGVVGIAASSAEKRAEECGTVEGHSIDEEVERVKSEIRLLEGMSIKAKLRELEALKQAVKDIDVNSIAERHVGKFRFPHEVEALWDTKQVVNRTNIDLFIARACQRLSSRYEDALDAIADFPMCERSDTTRVLGSALYAEALTSAHNYDAAAVQALQNLARESLVLFYRAKRRHATVGAAVRPRRADTVLGPAESGFLPRDWWSAQVLRPPVDVHLPPARHILTARFSFVDAEELKSLETLRVEFQREVLDAFIRLPKALSEVWQHCHTPIHKHEQLQEEQDISASLVRLLAGKEEDKGVWTTIARSTFES
ncbi:hypothetical protein DQ04_07971010 [Trypanosoma grayi]|uniref:hypothetical protein n=1 Tax=Trypanosoma grayi TaxID=71804 RepID=UPI0004F450FA|nr:hypothetical protein DQ04_07971010 [Trypanosoma grayi]KEG08118.1 hypothetical protein DQ04_07971010 [Trypanosoma grayi]